MALLLGLAPALPAGTEADSVTRFLERNGCKRVQGWVKSGAREVFDQWALDYVRSGGTGPALEIAAGGEISDLLGSLDQVGALLQSAEATVAGDWAHALRTASTTLLERAIDVGLGASGKAVWDVMKELGEIAKDLKEESLQINLRRYAEAAEGDPRLLGPGGADVLLEEYLYWRDPFGFERPGAAARRGMVIDYAHVVLMQGGFPAFPEWRQHPNQVRSAVASMLKDIAIIVETRRRQRRLEALLPALRQEVETVRRFQSFWKAIQAVSCGETAGTPLEPCLADLAEARARLADLEGDAPPSLEPLHAEAEAALARMAGELDATSRLAAQQDRAVQEHCRDVARQGEQSRRLLERAWEDARHAARLRDEVRRAARSACGGGDVAAKRLAAGEARTRAEEVARIQSALDALVAGLDELSLEPPVAAPVDGLLLAEERANDRLARLHRSRADRANRLDRLRDGLAAVDGQLASCRSAIARVPECVRASGSPLTAATTLGSECRAAVAASLSPVVTDALERAGAVRARLTQPQPADETAVTALDERFGQLRDRTRELLETRRTARACLDGLPSVSEVQAEARSLRDGSEVLSESTIADARRAAECAADPQPPVTPGHPDPQAGDPSAGDGDDWVAGDVEPAGEAPTVTGGGWDAGPVQPGGAPTTSGGFDPAPLIQAATAAAGGCRYPEALGYADRLSREAPAHPWLAANHARLQTLSERQRSAARALEQGRGAVERADFKGASAAAQRAADRAPSCMRDRIIAFSDAVNRAAFGDWDRKRRSRAGDTRGRDVAAAVLPGLLDLLNTAIESASGGPPATGGGSPTGGNPARPVAEGSSDPCATKAVYRNKWNPTPSCECPGYRWNGIACAPGPGGGTPQTPAGGGTGPAPGEACSCRVDAAGAGSDGFCDTFLEKRDAQGRLDPFGRNVVIHVLRHERGEGWRPPPGWLHGRFNTCEVLTRDSRQECAIFCR